MKFFIAFLCMVLAFGAVSAQNSLPRFGNTPNQDNTGRVLTYKFLKQTDVVGPDTLKFQPGAYTTIIRATLIDSSGLQIRSNATAYTGDQLQVIASGASGTKLKFIGTNWQSAGSAVLSTGQYAVVSFIFSGTKWVEVSRTVQ